MKLNTLSFSPQIQAFYDPSLDYPELPSDLIEVTGEQHTQLLNAINLGCMIFGDLSCSGPKPSQFHMWEDGHWVDPRTKEEQLAFKHAQYASLTRYQFLHCLLENGYTSLEMETKIQSIEDDMARELALLGFKEATNFVRTDGSILAMQAVLSLTDERVDEMWEYALTL